MWSHPLVVPPCHRRRQRVGNESFVVNLSETSGVDLAALEEIRSAHFGEMVKFVMSVFIFRLNNGIHMTEPLLFQWVLSFVHTNSFCKLMSRSSRTTFSIDFSTV